MSYVKNCETPKWILFLNYSKLQKIKENKVVSYSLF